MDVAEKVEAATVHVAVLKGSGLSVLEQNYEYDLLSPAKLLEKYVGERVTLVRQGLEDSSTVEQETVAKLLSTNNGTVWEANGRIVSNPHYDRIVFPNVPENLFAQPTLVWLVEAAGAGRRVIETSYLTGGMSWRADYVLALDAAEARAGLQGWVTIDNRSGAGYEGARLKLVAGDVHRVADRMPAAPKARPLMQARAAGVQQEAFFEYHLYSLPRLTDLRQNQTKQVQLLDASEVRVEKDYVLRGQPSYYLGPWSRSGKEKVQVFLRLENSKAAGLGMPLPKGIVRVYKRDRSGSPQLIGEDRIDHTPKDEKVRLELGNAFDVSAERKQVDFTRISKEVSESAFEIKIRNHKEDPVTVRVVEPVGGDWSMIQSSHRFEKSAAFEATFEISAPPNEETVLSYRVRVRR
jgi:hypothetical protein